LVAHIEGGEISGTIDELIRHSTSKMSHVHFVSNDLAKIRLVQMGELPASIFTIGSPDVDIMFSDSLPSIEEAKKYYEIYFEDYAVALFHPVTTEAKNMDFYVTNFVAALKESKKNYVIIYPNNDWGSNHILKAYKQLEDLPNFRIFPSVRFEYFLKLLEHASFIIGNSSAGIREAPYYGVPTINIGTRQENRALHAHIINTPYPKEDILKAIRLDSQKVSIDKTAFGNGNSNHLFLECLQSESIWNLDHQKQFRDFNESE
jgi:UDP-N-acetylglucosamine 2-epimerase (hydrolysing)